MNEIDKNSLVREKLRSEHSSPFSTYVELTVGQVGLSHFLLYELLTSLLGPIHGGLGFYLSKKLYPQLFRKVGRGLIINHIKPPAKLVRT